MKNRVTEAGYLGAAILAGAGHHDFPSSREGISRMVHHDLIFNPNK